MFDITGNNYISQKEFDSFLDLIKDDKQRHMIESFKMLIDRNIDTKITRSEWISFCNKILRLKLLQNLQEWETNHSPLPNPKNISAQYTAQTKEERNRRDLINLQLDKALTVFSEGFKTFINHFEQGTTHTQGDKDIFVRSLGYWILSRFERWDAIFNWIYQLLDDDGDGRLTPKECAQQFQTFGVSNTHVRELFEYFDEDGDGVITREEWHLLSETIRRLLFNYFKI